MSSEDRNELEARLQKVEETLKRLQDAGLEKWLAVQAPLLESCHLHVPINEPDQGVHPPDHPPEPLQPVQKAVSQQSPPVQPESPQVESVSPKAEVIPWAEPKDALKRYHNRASVVERREHGVDYEYLVTEVKEYYTFGESTWDLLMLIGTGSLGPAGAFQTILLVVMNILMQGIFVGIAWFNFLEPDVDAQTIQDAFRWRRSSAHSLSEYDSVSRMSLAERVCSGDKSLHISGVQMGLLENIEKYLKPTKDGLETYFAGPVLCMVALICWYMMVGKEVSHALALHRGLVAIPRGRNKIEPRENPFTQITHFRLVAITKRRVVASYCLLIYRLVAAALLIYVGTFFLVYTIDVTELILNAVALEIILDIDDLIFDAMATTTGRHLVHQLEPLPMPTLPRIHGADVKSIFMSCLLPALTLLVYFSMVAPMVQDLQSVYADLCGGNLAFVWSIDKRRVMQFSPTQGDGWDDSTGSFQLRAISEAIGLDLNQLHDSQLGLWHGDVTRLTETESLSLEELVDQGNPNCEDLAATGPMLNLLRDGLGNQSITSCADVLPYCDSVSKMPEWEVDGGKGFLTRMLCSETCGCSSPGGDFMNVQGCPYGRHRPCLSSAKFKATLQSATCEEKSATELRQFGPWIRWISQLRSFGQSVSNGTLVGQSEALKVAQAMWDHGCNFGSNLTEQNITWGDCFEWSTALAWEFKTLEFFCPTTCGCDRTKMNSVCPQPLGLTCDVVAECVLIGSSYFCHGDVPSVVGVLQINVNDELLNQWQTEVLQGLQMVLASVAGVVAAAVKVELAAGIAAPPPPGRRLRVEAVAFEIFLVEAEPRQVEVESLLAATSAEAITTSYKTQLKELVDVDIDTFQPVNVESFTVAKP